MIVDVDELKQELERLAKKNLDKATFAEERDIIDKLGTSGSIRLKI